MEGEETDPPFEWVISRICEEFSCLPSEAVDELMNDPLRMVLDIIDLRAYAKAKETLKNAKKTDDVPKSPMIDKVFEIEYELAKRGGK